MENTLENKAKFFALYWGQEIIKDQDCDVAYPVERSNILLEIHQSFLELKPLSSISDEDAKELSLRLTNVVGLDNIIKKQPIDLVREVVGNYERLGLIHLLPAMFIDKCRKLGYAVPYDDLQVDKMKEYGWVKLREL